MFLVLVPFAFWIVRVGVFARIRTVLSRSSHRRITNVVFPYGIYDSIGRRPYMEDRFLVVGELRGDPRASIYAVFDGHGGAAAAEFCVNRMVPLLVSDPAFPLLPVKAISNAFVRTDEEFLAHARSCRPPLDDGTTAIAALIMGRTLLVANAGDSRAILVHRDGTVEAMSDDHKPNRPDEIQRIKQAGGVVYFHGVWRVGGVLAVSRAIGDRILKPVVTAQPELKQCTITAGHAFLVLATDGVWDVMTNDDVGAIVSSICDPQEAASRLVMEALDRGSADNITALVINLTTPRCPLVNEDAAAYDTDGFSSSSLNGGGGGSNGMSNGSSPGGSGSNVSGYGTSSSSSGAGATPSAYSLNGGRGGVSANEDLSPRSPSIRPASTSSTVTGSPRHRPNSFYCRTAASSETDSSPDLRPSASASGAAAVISPAAQQQQSHAADVLSSADSDSCHATEASTDGVPWGPTITTTTTGASSSSDGMRGRHSRSTALRSPREADGRATSTSSALRSPRESSTSTSSAVFNQTPGRAIDSAAAKTQSPSSSFIESSSAAATALFDVARRSPSKVAAATSTSRRDAAGAAAADAASAPRRGADATDASRGSTSSSSTSLPAPYSESASSRSPGGLGQRRSSDSETTDASRTTATSFSQGRGDDFIVGAPFDAGTAAAAASASAALQLRESNAIDGTSSAAAELAKSSSRQLRALGSDALDPAQQPQQQTDLNSSSSSNAASTQQLYTSHSSNSSSLRDPHAIDLNSASDLLLITMFNDDVISQARAPTTVVTL